MRNRGYAGIVAVAIAALVPAAASAESGLYIGAGLGSAGVAEEFEGFDFDDDVAAYRFLAGLNLGGRFGIEAGYQNFGNFEESFDIGGFPSRARLTAEGWTLGGTLSLPLTDFFSVFGRGGLFLWEADIELDGIRAAVEDDSNPYYGAGAKVGVTRNLSLTGDWTRYELDSVDTDVFSVGFEYRFGN